MALSDRSLLDEGCESTNVDDAMESRSLPDINATLSLFDLKRQALKVKVCHVMMAYSERHEGRQRADD
ncbi:hypothetical protein Scep_010280 [Stephania cephalantha]|uniref:Uncharacterized protein n=1 Tax=Stephania cephalantha TaxID=152367 RepID=A0AAP0JVI4_9MAGN